MTTFEAWWTALTISFFAAYLFFLLAAGFADKEPKEESLPFKISLSGAILALLAIVVCVVAMIVMAINAMPQEYNLGLLFFVFAVPFTLFVGGKIGKKVWT